MKQYNKSRKSCALLGLGFLEMIPSPRLGFFRGVITWQVLITQPEQPKDRKHSNKN